MKKVLVVLVAAALGAAVWFFFLRTKEVTPAGHDSPIAAKTEGQKPEANAAPKETGQSAERPPTPRVSVDDDPEGQLRLEGQVIDADEQPVEGATVVVSSNPPRRVQTEKDGSFTIDKLIGRSYSVTARKGGEYAEGVSVRLTAKTEPVILRLRKGGELEITVVEAGSKTPLSGATVELRGLLEVTAQTDGSGKAKLEGVAPGWHAVRATKEGYAPSATVFDTEGGEGVHKHTITLARGGAVVGKVVGPDGAPVAGATVVPVDASQMFAWSDEQRDGVKSDAAGKFTIPALPAGTYRFEGQHKDYARGTSGQVRLDGKSEKADVVVTLGASGRVAGAVLDLTGKPVPGATVRVASREGRSFWDVPMRQVYTDDAGTFDV
jgi:protocatechuate 3,4-dioxygenase beta subunit